MIWNNFIKFGKELTPATWVAWTAVSVGMTYTHTVSPTINIISLIIFILICFLSLSVTARNIIKKDKQHE